VQSSADPEAAAPLSTLQAACEAAEQAENQGSQKRAIGGSNLGLPACLAHGAGRDNASSRPGTAEARKGLLLAGAVAGGQPAVGGQPSKAANRRSLTFFIPDPHARGELQSISGEAAAPPDESAKAVTVPHLAPELLLSSAQESEFGGGPCASSQAHNALRGVGSRAGTLAGLETVDWELSGSLKDVSTHQLVAASSACMMTSAGRVASQPPRA
jgi:hypothetical protein